MIILDNIIFNLQKSGGVSVVWKELINRLLMENGKYLKFLEYTCSNNNIFRESINISPDTIYSQKAYCLAIQRYIPLMLLNIHEPNIFHSSYYRYSLNPYSKNITTVHDFTYEYFVKGIKGTIHKWQKYSAIRHSKYIVCISENTKKDLLKFLPDINPDTVRVIYNGVSDDYCILPANKSVNLPFPSQSYVLFVGGREAYKNFYFTVNSLRDSSYNLVIVGASLTDIEIQVLNQCLKANRYYYAGRVSNIELNTLYNNAFALMYPSSYEGFGIPILEAQKSGCPVIAYNASSIPEVIGDTSLLLDNLNIKEVHNKLSILRNQDLRKYIISLGIENSKRFTWDRMYQQYIDLYNEVLHNL